MATPIYVYTFARSSLQNITLGPIVRSFSEYTVNTTSGAVTVAGDPLSYQLPSTGNESGGVYLRFDSQLGYSPSYFLSPSNNLPAEQVVNRLAVSELPSPLNCYLPGTMIATAAGDVPVEALRAGDMVLTASGALRPIRWIGTGAVRQGWRESLDPQRVPVRIRAGALGGDASGPLPRRDLLVTHNHGMMVDGVLIPAAWLRNGSSIVSELGLTAWDYFHIELDSHDILLAEGAASESYRFCGNRAIFDNAGTAPGDAGPHEPSCLPIILEGPILEQARQDIIALAERQAANARAACPALAY